MIAFLCLGLLLVTAGIFFRNALRLRLEEAWLCAALWVCVEQLFMVRGFAAFHRLQPASMLWACGLLIAVHLGAALYFQSAKRAAGGLELLRAYFPPWIALAALGTFAAIGLRLYIAWKTPPISWDGLCYHLPIVYRWVSQGDLSLQGWRGFQSFGALGSEMVFAWLALLDGGRLDAAKIGQVAAMPAFFAAGAVLGRRLAGPLWTGACALASITLPVVLVQLGLSYVDIFYGAYCLAALACAAVYDRTGRWIWLLFFTLSFGLALGAKSTAYLQAPLLLPVLWTFWARPELRRSMLRSALPLSILVVAVGGMYYVDNLRLRGNPVYPFIVNIPFYGQLPGVLRPSELLSAMEQWMVPKPIYWLWYPFREVYFGSVAFTLSNGFGPLFAAAWAAFPLALWRGWRLRNRSAAAFLWTFPAVLIAFFLFQPARAPRYIIFLAPIPIAGLAMLLRQVRGWARNLAQAAWAAGTLYACAASIGCMASSMEWKAAVGPLKSSGAVDARAYYRATFSSLGEAWSALDERLKPGDVVAINYGELMFPWAGLPPRAVVWDIPRKDSPYPETYGATSAGEWLGVLDELGVRYLGIWMPKWYADVGVGEEEAIAAYPERFTRLGEWNSGEFGRVALYEMKPSTRTAALPFPLPPGV
ncbi:MAG: hypothetical protein WCU88_02510 [Elusimicrobiota bacterium]